MKKLCADMKMTVIPIMDGCLEIISNNMEKKVVELDIRGKSKPFGPQHCQNI